MDRIEAEWTTALESDGRRSLEDGSFEPDASQTTLTVDVPLHRTGGGDQYETAESNNLHQFIAQALGYSRYVGPGQNLDRWCPARHPLFPFLRCSKISRMEGLVETLIREQSPLGRIRGRPLLTPLYRMYRLTLLFTSPSYAIRENAEIVTERDRYITEMVTPSVEMLTKEGHFYEFVEGTPVAGRKFPQPIGFRVPAFDRVSIWHQVPAEAILDGLYPTKIASMISKVNDQVMPMGTITRLQSQPVGGTYAAGELLLTGAQLTPELSPVPPQVMGLGVFDFPRTYRVQYNFSVQPKGHNNKPSPLSPSDWYLVTHNGLGTGLGGKPLYESADLNELWVPR